MAVVSTNHRWFRSNSGYNFFDFSWLLEMAATIQSGKQKADTKAPLLEDDVETLDAECDAKVVEGESKSESAKTADSGRVEGGEDVPACAAEDDTDCTKTEVREDSNLDTSELKRMFQTFDENQDDLICAADLRRFMSRLGIEVSEEEAVSMVSTVDHDGDGNVAFEEFCSLYRALDDGNDSSTAGEKRVDEEEEDSLLEAFRLFDKNNDGFISCQELQSVLLALGLPEGKSLKSCQLMIQGVDSDGNGEVDIKEFKRMMSSNSFLR